MIQPKNKRGPGSPNWGGVREESKKIEEIHDQWCRDHGYRITARVVHRGKAAPQYGRKCGRNKAK
tara:strand:+ start:838 stop:1032 length:195 start_codon:yes stop_codon:yes gene_type:complete